MHQLPLLAYLADKIWNESAKILSNDSAVCLSPGCSDKSRWLVQSADYKQKSLFLWSVIKMASQIACEQACGIFNCRRVCTHFLSVALRVNQIDAYIKWLQKKAVFSKIFKAGNVDMPKRSGKKQLSSESISETEHEAG